MTIGKDFKARVRDRMVSTGENYTTARAALMASAPSDPTQGTRAHTNVHGADDPDPFYARTVRSFFDGRTLRSIPAKRRARVVVLMELLTGFRRGRSYTELEVNDILRQAHPDVAALRREMVEYRYLHRSGGVYRVAEEALRRGPDEAQEVPADEADRLRRIPTAADAHQAEPDA